MLTKRRTMVRKSFYDIWVMWHCLTSVSKFSKLSLRYQSTRARDVPLRCSIMDWHRSMLQTQEHGLKPHRKVVLYI